MNFLSRDHKLKNIENLIDELVDSNIDGIAFEHNPKLKDSIEILGLTFPDGKFKKHDLGYKYNIITYKITKEKNKYYFEDIESYSTILGDPRYFIKNHIKSGYFGLIMKKCRDSDLILAKLLLSIS